MAVWFTLEGSGPFAQGSLNASLLLLLAFMCTVVTTGLVLSAIIHERGARDRGDAARCCRSCASRRSVTR